MLVQYKKCLRDRLEHPERLTGKPELSNARKDRPYLTAYRYRCARIPSDVGLDLWQESRRCLRQRQTNGGSQLRPGRLGGSAYVSIWVLSRTVASEPVQHASHRNSEPAGDGDLRGTSAVGPKGKQFAPVEFRTVHFLRIAAFGVVRADYVTLADHSFLIRLVHAAASRRTGSGLSSAHTSAQKNLTE
jgi:hypothetical protein